MNGAEQWLRWPDYASWTWETWAAYILAGTVGYIVRLSITGQPIRAPRRLPSGAVYLNTLGEWVTSCAVATLADHNLVFATVAGLGASSIAQTFMRWIPAATRRALGIPEPAVREKEA